MLTAEAVRLAAMEVLCPTAAIAAQSGYPTLAGALVFDSRAAHVDELAQAASDGGSSWQPVLALYTRQSDEALRGEAAGFDDVDATTVLEIVAELSAVIDGAEGGPFVDAVDASDAQARLTLMTLVGQVKRLLLFAESGWLFRKTILSVERVEEETHAIPEFGLRFQRVFLRLHCRCRHDEFPADGGLPQPLADLRASLPAGSYARSMLDALGAAFPAEPPTPLGSVHLDAPGGIDAGTDHLDE